MSFTGFFKDIRYRREWKETDENMYAEGPDRAALEVDVLKLYSVNDDDADNDDGRCTIGTDAAASIVRPCAEGMLRL